MAKGRRVDGGQFYERRASGEMVPATPQAPDVWICRRVADYPQGVPPAGAALGVCADCGRTIAYNPQRILTVPLETPQVCMQCSGIEPLPIL